MLTGAMKEARAGFFPAQAAVDALKPMFLAAVAKPPAALGRLVRRQGAEGLSRTDDAGEPPAT